MKIHAGIHRFLLVLYSVLGGAVILFNLLLILSSVGENCWESLWFSLKLCGAFFLLAYTQMWHTAEMLLTEEGVFIRVLYRQKFYSWGVIQQAGVLYSLKRGVPYERLYLLKPGGSRRRYQDKAFLSRNFGKLICLPADEETKNYVTAHYGPLDFNLPYGSTEQSQVVDMDLMGDTQID